LARGLGHNKKEAKFAACMVALRAIDETVYEQWRKKLAAAVSNPEEEHKV
jgi:hypothetical protein